MRFRAVVYRCLLVEISEEQWVLANTLNRLRMIKPRLGDVLLVREVMYYLY